MEEAAPPLTFEGSQRFRGQLVGLGIRDDLITEVSVCGLPCPGGGEVGVGGARLGLQDSEGHRGRGAGGPTQADARGGPDPIVEGHPVVGEAVPPTPIGDADHGAQRTE